MTTMTAMTVYAHHVLARPGDRPERHEVDPVDWRAALRAHVGEEFAPGAALRWCCDCPAATVAEAWATAPAEIVAEWAGTAPWEQQAGALGALADALRPLATAPAALALLRAAAAGNTGEHAWTPLIGLARDPGNWGPPADRGIVAAAEGLRAAQMRRHTTSYMAIAARCADELGMDGAAIIRAAVAEIPPISAEVPL